MLSRCVCATSALALLALLAGCPSGAVSSVKVGEKAKDFTLRTVDGGTFTLSALQGSQIAVIGVGNPFG
jgi:hypothetical protein